MNADDENLELRINAKEKSQFKNWIKALVAFALKQFLSL